MAKASFLPAYRMKEVVLLEAKNLGRIILDKMPGMGRGTKCRRRSLGLAVGPWWFLPSVALLPLSTPLGMHIPVTGQMALFALSLCAYFRQRGRRA